MRKNLLLWLTCIAGPLVFTSCQLMPEEDVLPASPVIYSYEAQEYEMTSVMRGDLVLSTTVNCTYIPAKEESLSFSLGSMYIDNVNVSEGDRVAAGQVLAELEQGNLQEQIAAQNYQLKVLELKKSHIEENRDLDLLKYDIILHDLEWELEHTNGVRVNYLEEQKEKRLEERAEVEEAYADQIQAAEDSIYLQKLRSEELKEDLKKRQIIAGIDGTVTYVRSVTEGQRSVKNQTLITISDLDTTVFVVKGEESQYFPEGTEVVITCQKKEFLADAVPADTFGMEVDNEEPMVYLRLRQPDPTLKDGARGKIDIVLEQSLNTLYVAKEAVGMVNGEAFVYMLDENGMRIMQKVTTGLKNKQYIEIVDGLEENDSVIIN